MLMSSLLEKYSPQQTATAWHFIGGDGRWASKNSEQQEEWDHNGPLHFQSSHLRKILLPQLLLCCNGGWCEECWSCGAVTVRENNSRHCKNCITLESFGNKMRKQDYAKVEKFDFIRFYLMQLLRWNHEFFLKCVIVEKWLLQWWWKEHYV